MMTILSCSKKPIIRTEIKEVEVVKFLPVSKELTQDCQTIIIEDKKHDVSDLMDYILDLISFNQDCSNEKRAIRKITTPE